MKTGRPSNAATRPSAGGRGTLAGTLATLLVVLAAPAAEDAQANGERNRMVEEQIRARGVTNSVVLEAMRRVPRHQFVEANLRRQAYDDQPLPIGHGQTISQPYIVALMTELLEVKPGQKVLEVGTGSGYQAAVLFEITTNVYTIEIVRPLYEKALRRLKEAGLPESRVRHGDGYFGWEEQAPFDAIIVTAAADHIPPPLLKQLRPGARMVVPIGPVHATQRLVVVQKGEDGKVKTRSVLPVRFVPLVRE
ncbi:MAG: protein-L-isoaspartate(D-aspartate) O-methyltransferase [Verrucomicrobia bacterium]|nr:MAG: protein-L-isoaspartate(D-aspartate) O-methyltransferase [Verrucomicrobiota bacterium]